MLKHSAKLLRDGLASLNVEIKNHNPCTHVGELSRGGRAQTRGAAGHNSNSRIFKYHKYSPNVTVGLRTTMAPWYCNQR
jgi:hypothetical protein